MPYLGAIVDLQVELNNSEVQTSCLGSIVHISCTLWIGEDTNKYRLKQDQFFFYNKVDRNPNHNLTVLNFHPIPFYKEVTFELKLIGVKQEKLFQYVGYVQIFFSFQLDDNI